MESSRYLVFAVGLGSACSCFSVLQILLQSADCSQVWGEANNTNWTEGHPSKPSSDPNPDPPQLLSPPRGHAQALHSGWTPCLKFLPACSKLLAIVKPPWSNTIIILPLSLSFHNITTVLQNYPLTLHVISPATRTHTALCWFCTASESWTMSVSWNKALHRCWQK